MPGFGCVTSSAENSRPISGWSTRASLASRPVMPAGLARAPAISALSLAFGSGCEGDGSEHYHYDDRGCDRIRRSGRLRLHLFGGLSRRGDRSALGLDVLAAGHRADAIDQDA